MSYLKSKLPPDVNRVLLVKNLPFNITTEEMFDIFGRYGAIRQIRKGNAPDTKGTAFVVYENIFDAQRAVEQLSGFNICGRYLIVLYYHPYRQTKKTDLQKRREELDQLQDKYGITVKPE